MSRYLTLTNQSSVRFNERKGALKTRPTGTSGLTLNFVLTVLICAVAVLYIFEVNNLATKGFEIKKLENDLNELKKESDALNLRAAELKSMYNIQEKTKDLNMVAPIDISYLNIPGDVAMK